MRVIKWLVIWPVLSIMCYCIIVMWLPERAEEYGPHPPTDTDRIEALEKALENLERIAHEAPWWLDDTMKGVR